jgi:signal transduction histidine kinase
MATGPARVDPAAIARGKVLFDQVRADYGTLRQQLLEARTDERDRLARRTNALFGVVLGVAILVAVASVALFVALRRWVTGPLRRLGDDVRRVRDGQLDHPVTAAGPPEIRAVASDVDAMRLALVQRFEQVRLAGEEIESSRQRLVEQAEELSRSNRDLEQFAYVASHDLQEPLRKVASFCQLLERRYAGQLDERADQYIAFAVDGAKRMQQLINDLLAFSRVGRAGVEDVGLVPLQVPFDRALSNLAAAIEHSEAEISTDPLPTVRGETGLLAQLFQNVIGNALKFRGDQAPRVRVAVQDREDHWELTVVDNGIGVEPQYAERVFVIFQRLHPKASYEGTGIGLALCKRIVEHHGGQIWIESPQGGGTAVVFTLPKPPAEAPA